MIIAESDMTKYIVWPDGFVAEKHELDYYVANGRSDDVMEIIANDEDHALELFNEATRDALGMTIHDDKESRSESSLNF